MLYKLERDTEKVESFDKRYSRSLTWRRVECIEYKIKSRYIRFYRVRYMLKEVYIKSKYVNKSKIKRVNKGEVKREISKFKFK